MFDFEDELIEIKENTGINETSFDRIIKFVEEIIPDYPDVAPVDWLNVIETASLSYATKSEILIGTSRTSLEKAVLLALKKQLGTDYSNDFFESSNRKNF